MRTALVLLLIGAVGPVLPAQVLGVRLKDKKTERRYKKYLHRYNDDLVLCGEPKAGIRTKGALQVTGDVIELWVADPGAPDKVPYRIRNGERVVAHKKGILTVPRTDLIKRPLFYLMRDQTLLGLSAEYHRRATDVEEAKIERAAAKRATAAWFRAQRKVVNRLQRLRTWLASTLFSRAGKKLERKINTELRTLKEDAVGERARIAQASVEMIPVPDDFAEATRKLGGAPGAFNAAASRHLRVIAPDVLSDVHLKRLLQLGERVIEDTRRELVDPWVEQADYEDRTPDGPFHQYAFVPDDPKTWEGYFIHFIGRRWRGDEDRAHSLKTPGSRNRNVSSFDFTDYWRLSDNRDTEGVIVHGLGHSLAAHHFGFNGRAAPDWLEEGFAYYLSFEHLGRNSVTCVQLKRDRYDRSSGKEGIRGGDEGQRRSFNELALRKGPPISELVLKELYQLDDADMAMSWSLIDYLVRKEGKRGVLWLRAVCEQTAKRDGAIERLRAETARIFEVADGEDALKALKSLWREYARSGQEKGSGRRRR